MRMYLLLKECAQAFRKDPSVQQALDASRTTDLMKRTLTKKETWRDLKDTSLHSHIADRGYDYVH